MSIFKNKKTSDIELQYCHHFDNEHKYVCFDCLFMSGELDPACWLRNAIDAIEHLNKHIQAGHMVPNEAIQWIQNDVFHQSIVHQSAMNPGRRFDGSFSGFCENVYHEAWLKENGNSINDQLLIKMFDGCGLGAVTHRDAVVAATLVTWLGTNVGRCFVDKCLEKIKQWKTV